MHKKKRDTVLVHERPRRAREDCTGASDTVASAERFESYPIEKTTASGTTFSSAVGKQAEVIVNVGLRYIGVRCAEDLVKTRYWRSVVRVVESGHSVEFRHPTQSRKKQTKQLQRLQDALAAAMICEWEEDQDQINNKRQVFIGGACDEWEARATVHNDRADRAWAWEA